MTEMEQLVAKLRTLSKEEMNEEYLRKTLSAFRKDVPKREAPLIGKYADKCAIVFSSGFTLNILIDGSMYWTWNDGMNDDTKLEPGTKTPGVGLSVIEDCFKHMVSKIHDSYKSAPIKEAPKPSPDREIRYIKNNDAKKAFVAGMILGMKKTEG